jgi:hypothetical protein
MGADENGSFSSRGGPIRCSCSPSRTRRATSKLPTGPLLRLARLRRPAVRALREGCVEARARLTQPVGIAPKVLQWSGVRHGRLGLAAQSPRRASAVLSLNRRSGMVISAFVTGLRVSGSQRKYPVDIRGYSCTLRSRHQAVRQVDRKVACGVGEAAADCVAPGVMVFCHGPGLFRFPGRCSWARCPERIGQKWLWSMPE